MKNTKKYLSMGVALAIVLLASVQVSAMERPVNSYLNRDQKKLIVWKLNNTKMKLSSCDPKRNPDQKFQAVCNELSKLSQQLEELYYGDRPYTDDEIDEIIHG
jgi:hypothetical protein